MSKPMVTIIMPVYGVENYVGKAIESIESQTFTDWELLCVDDGTKDRSGEICDEYAKKDPRITVFHKENGGAPSARNIAIDKSNGKYMYFMDSDDWAEPGMLEHMVSLAENNEAQLVIAGFYIDTYYTDDDMFVESKFEKAAIYKNKETFRTATYKLFDQNLLYTPWNKLYLSEYIISNKIYFPHTFWDDFPFNLSVIRDIERVIVTPNCYYHFTRKRIESETAKYRVDMYEKREEEHTWMEELYSYWGLSTPGVQEFLSRRYIERLIGCVENLTNEDCTLSFFEICKRIKTMINSPRTIKAAAEAKPNSTYMKIMLIPIKYRMVWLTYLEGRVISFVKTENTELFAKLKAYR